MSDKPKGSTRCPICLRDSPHEHTGEEVHAYRFLEIQWNRKLMSDHEELVKGQAERRKKSQDATEARQQRVLEAAVKAIDEYKTACHFCRGLPEGNQKLKGGCAWEYGLVIDRERDTASCPECNRCLVSWES